MSALVKDEAYVSWAKDDMGISVASCLKISIVEISSEESDATDGFAASVERGIVAKEPIEAGRELFAVPFDALLHADSPYSAASDATKALCALLSREDDILALRLLHERHDASSRWAPHLTRLPPGPPPHCVLRWSEDELQELRGSDALVMATRWRGQIRQDFAEVYAAALTLDVKSFEWLDFEAYSWAISMIWSRGLSLSREGVLRKCIVPVFDMINHSSAASEEHGFDVARDAFYCKTHRSYEPGEEVFIAYDKLPNARLLLLYGFAVSEDDTHAKREFYAPLPTQAPNYTAKRAALEDLGLAPFADGAKAFELTIARPLPAELLTTIRIHRADTQAEMDGSALSRLSVANERAALGALLGAAQSMLAAYTTADDEAILLSAACTPRLRLAITVRLPERKILQGMQDILNTLLADLDSES